MFISRQYMNVGGFAFNSSAMYLPLLFSLPLLPSFLFPSCHHMYLFSLPSCHHTSFLFPLATILLFSSLLPPHFSSLLLPYLFSLVHENEAWHQPPHSIKAQTRQFISSLPFETHVCPLTTKYATNHSPSTLEQLQKLPRRRKLQDPITTIHDQHYILRVGAAGSSSRSCTDGLNYLHYIWLLLPCYI